MYSVDDPKFKNLICGDFSLEELERRLRPELGLNPSLKDSFKKEIEAHAGFADFSHQGFIGKNEKLLEIVHSDWQLLSELGVNHNEIADALENLPAGLSKGYEYDEPYVCTPGGQSCPWGCRGPGTYGQNTGVIKKAGTDVILQTPFSLRESVVFKLTSEMWGELKESNGSDEFRRKFDEKVDEEVEKRRKSLKPRTKFSDVPLTRLLPHLIRDHYFFEGKWSPYRADPEFLCKAFGLGKYKR